MGLPHYQGELWEGISNNKSKYKGTPNIKMYVIVMQIVMYGIEMLYVPKRK
jgi:hypothetical protein